MGADVTHNNLARDSFLDSTEINYNGDGDQPIAVMTMVYNIGYQTTEVTPDVALQRFFIMDKNVMVSSDGKSKIIVFDSEVENLKANGWTLEKESKIKTKSKED